MARYCRVDCPHHRIFLETVMGKMIFAFLSMCIILYTGIDIFRRLTGKEKMEFIKLASYSLGIATITSILAVVIIVLF